MVRVRVLVMDDLVSRKWECSVAAGEYVTLI